MPALPLWQAIDWQEVGVWIAALLTLIVLSAAFVESRFSRAAFALFAGTAIGYMAAVSCRAILWPRLLLFYRDPVRQWPVLIWFFLGLLLLARGLNTASWLSNLSLAYLIGVGAALAAGGAALGTVVPQIMAVAVASSQTDRSSAIAIANALLVALGTVGVLFRFTYTKPKGEHLIGRMWTGVTGILGRVGSAYLAVAFGALLATAIISLMALLTSRLQFLLADWLRLAVR